MSTMLALLRPFSFMRVKTSHPASRCLPNGEDVKSGELPQFPLSPILIYALMSCPSFATSPASCPNSRRMASSTSDPS